MPTLRYSAARDAALSCRSWVAWRHCRWLNLRVRGVRRRLHSLGACRHRENGEAGHQHQSQGISHDVRIAVGSSLGNRPSATFRRRGCRVFFENSNSTKPCYVEGKTSVARSAHVYRRIRRRIADARKAGRMRMHQIFTKSSGNGRQSHTRPRISLSSRPTRRKPASPT